jgi:hypothetical protein
MTTFCIRLYGSRRSGKAVVIRRCYPPFHEALYVTFDRFSDGEEIA